MNLTYAKMLWNDDEVVKLKIVTCVARIVATSTIVDVGKRYYGTMQTYDGLSMKFT